MFSLLSVAFCLLAVSAIASGSESDAGVFAYYGNPNSTGPLPHNWGTNPEWRLCGVGQEQSPIDIVTINSTNVPDLFELDTSYGPANGTIFIDSDSILEVEVKGGGQFKIDSKTYHLEQFHFHSPSEHTIDGVRFPLEVHLVHMTTSGDIAVIGIVFSYGEENVFLSKLWNKIPLLTSPSVRLNLTNVDVREPNLRLGTSYSRYMGSLTTPPCSENVTWTVILGKDNTVSRQQMATYNTRLPYSNARPIQRLNKRQVQKRLGLLKRLT